MVNPFPHMKRAGQRTTLRLMKWLCMAHSPEAISPQNWPRMVARRELTRASGWLGAGEEFEDMGMDAQGVGVALHFFGLVLEGAEGLADGRDVVGGGVVWELPFVFVSRD